MNLFEHEDEYDSGYDAEPTGYKVVTIHYDEWLRHTKRLINRRWHRHLSRVTLEQLDFELKVEQWQRQMQRADARLAIYATPSSERSLDSLLGLALHQYEKGIIEQMSHGLWGRRTPTGEFEYKSDIHSVPQPVFENHTFQGIRVITHPDVPKDKVYLLNDGWMHPHLDEHEHGGES